MLIIHLFYTYYTLIIHLLYFRELLRRILFHSLVSLPVLSTHARTRAILIWHINDDDDDSALDNILYVLLLSSPLIWRNEYSTCTCIYAYTIIHVL